MLEIRGLRKSYGEVTALAGVDLSVAAGEIVSLLGPNGAGKTTLVSIVAGLRKADQGSVMVDGLDVRSHSREVRALIGLAPQDLGVYPVVSVRRNLQLFGELMGLTRKMVAQRIEEIAASLDLVELLDRQTGKLSGGQKRRLHTAIALLHRPKLLLLDEATSGADVETRARLLDLVRQLADEGSAVLYSTHYLQEVEELNANVVILDRGEVIARGAVIDLLARHAQPVVEFVFAGAVPPGAIDASIADYRIEGPRLRVPTSEPASVIAGVANRVPSGQLSSVEILRPSLETVYLAYAGRRYDEADKEVNVVTPV